MTDESIRAELRARLRAVCSNPGTSDEHRFALCTEAVNLLAEIMSIRPKLLPLMSHENDN